MCGRSQNQLHICPTTELLHSRESINNHFCSIERNFPICNPNILAFMIVKWRKYMYLHIPRFSIIAINRSNAVALCLYWLFYPTQIVRIFQSLWIILAFSQLNSFLTFLFAKHKSIMFSSEFLVRYFPIKGKKEQ